MSSGQAPLRRSERAPAARGTDGKVTRSGSDDPYRSGRLPVAAPNRGLDRLLEVRFGLLGHRSEGLGIPDRDVGQVAAIDLDPCLAQAEDQLVVVQAVEPGSGVDADDPETPEVPLPVAAIAVGVDLGPVEGFLRRAEEPAARPPEPLGLLEDLLLASARGDAVLDPWHPVYLLVS